MLRVILTCEGRMSNSDTKRAEQVKQCKIIKLCQYHIYFFNIISRFKEIQCANN